MNLLDRINMTMATVLEFPSMEVVRINVGAPDFVVLNMNYGSRYQNIPVTLNPAGNDIEVVMRAKPLRFNCGDGMVQ
jgi:hypothetical protein